MKILIIHNTYKEKGGEDKSFGIESQMLIDHGHQVETMVCENKDINSSIEIFKLSYRLFYNPKFASELQQKIESFKPDIIHVHNFFYIVSPSVFFVAKRNKIPVVFTVRNYRLICSGAYLLRNSRVCEICVDKKFPISGIIYKCHRNSAIQSAHLTMMTGVHKMLNTWANKIDKYIVLTQFAKKKLLKSSLNLKESQLIVKPNFTSDLGYTPYHKRENFFLFIGRLSTEKGIETLLKSFELGNYNLKVIGTGPYKNLIESYAEKHPGFEYLGFRSNDFIIEQLKKSKALLFPSIWYEGMPRTILEAYSTGTPVISSDIDNINEIVTNNYNGIHFKSGDAESLSKKIAWFQKKEDVDIFYENARRTFEERYTYEKNYDQLYYIYANLLSKEKLIET